AILPAVAKPSPSKARSSISIVGPGNLGTALALTLPSAGYQVKLLAARHKVAHVKALARKLHAQVIDVGKPLPTDVVWITVPDDAIAAVARLLASSQDWKGKIVFHSSGALTSDELSPLRAKGARVASVHPMMTFVRGVVPEMAGISFAVEGDAAAVRTARSIVEDLGGRPFVIKKQNKVLYHVFGSFASPMVIALMASLEEVARAAGIRQSEIKRVMEPLLSQTLRNYLQQEAASAFSGPLVRGDVATVRKHLAELLNLPEARAVYVALARASLNFLPVRNRRMLERELNGAERAVKSIRKP
ncbi:MAG: Rossmann-like and DUF2520 domain-containing protein, partial [Candidatus Korobacteraceae bacterium]